MSMRIYPIVGYGLFTDTVNWNTKALIELVDCDICDSDEREVFEQLLQRTGLSKFLWSTCCEEEGIALVMYAGYPWTFDSEAPKTLDEFENRVFEALAPFACDKAQLRAAIGEISSTYCG